MRYLMTAKSLLKNAIKQAPMRTTRTKSEPMALLFPISRVV